MPVCAAVRTLNLQIYTIIAKFTIRNDLLLPSDIWKTTEYYMSTAWAEVKTAVSRPS